jgi:hypothetical protein
MIPNPISGTTGARQALDGVEPVAVERGAVEDGEQADRVAGRVAGNGAVRRQTDGGVLDRGAGPAKCDRTGRRVELEVEQVVR